MISGSVAARLRDARDAEIGALLLDPLGDRLDPAVGLDDALVAVGGVAQQHVAFDQRLCEFPRERVDQPHLPGHVRRRVDDAVLAAEIGEPAAVLDQAVLGLAEILGGVADRVVARLFGQAVHHGAGHREDRLRDRLRVLGGEGVGAQVDDAGARLRNACRSCGPNRRPDPRS